MEGTMEEKRIIRRIKFPSKSIIVDFSTKEKYTAKTTDVSPVGMGVVSEDEIPNILGKDILIVAETLIMYAEVNRQSKDKNGVLHLGISGKPFTPEVLEYLFEHLSI